MDTGSFVWKSETKAFKTRIIDVVYNASNNELVRTKTLVKSAIVEVDATPFRQWYEAHYALPLGRKNAKDLEAAQDLTEKSEAEIKVINQRRERAEVDPALQAQFVKGRLLASISTRPGQVGKADGYILEGEELQFYLKKLTHKRHQKE